MNHTAPAAAPPRWGAPVLGLSVDGLPGVWGLLVRLPGVTGFYDDPDVALARVAADIEAARQRAERAVEVKASIDRVRGRARSARGEVTVETDASGQVTDLVLEETALNLRAVDLAALIRQTIRAAAHDAGTRAVAVAEDAYGKDSAISAHLRDELETRSR
ncbi:hypothetical protein Cch01nite_44670 [Cellulomonas chitinilytica]|uniref:YbaB/EbfC family DNA-binding protein n=2 Tax=Cellulomonas chitinilytica TaxID=398759 RepID=A0A919P832_9CELL|nr:hypothetical protein Cch01nite_44670 [Cellulomonas chitinilytica]